MHKVKKSKCGDVKTSLYINHNPGGPQINHVINLKTRFSLEIIKEQHLLA